MALSIRAKTVVLVDRPAIDDGIVTIEDDRITAVEPTSRGISPTRDLGDVVLMPGLVNAHTHLEFSHLEAPLGWAGMPLVEWLPLAIAARGGLGGGIVQSIAAGIQESVIAGTCALADIVTAEPAVLELSSQLWILPYLEAIGFSRARATSAFAAVERRVAEAERLRLQVGLSPHAPYTVSPELVGELVALARQKQMPVAMHLAESAEELELLSSGSGPFRDLLEARSMWDAAAIPRGIRPLDYLKLLAEAPRSLVIHGNYLTPDEHKFLGDHADRMTLVYCPRTHAYFDHPRYPLGELLEAGVRVALGTDSRASNPDLSVLGEMRQVAREHGAIPPETILRMATINGARALGCEEQCGSIAPGKLANLVAVPASNGWLTDLLRGDVEPSAIWLRGREV
jgi:aminodeoxyfutalosine deaminase